ARVQAGGGNVNRQLADGNVGAADALVADAEDAFGVGGNQQVDVVTLEAVVAQRLLHILGVIDVKENTAWAAIFVREAFNRFPNRGGYRRSAASLPDARPAAGRTALRCG